MRRIACRIATAMLLAPLPAVSAGPARPADAAIERATGEVMRGLASPAVRCVAAEDHGFVCRQTNLRGPRHYAIVGVEWAVARTPLTAGEVRIEGAFAGPGGGSGSYRGQTPDHRYDLRSSGGNLFGSGDRALLPSSPELIGRIARHYARIVAAGRGRALPSRR